jgi:L-alanine-DL-glutamate epimerase-like enolase superfamily enzyme
VKITRIDLYNVDIPPIPPIAKYAPRIFDLTVCQIHTDEGLVGLGEAHGPPPEHAEAAAALEGQDPLALDPFVQAEPFECALLDIAAQSAGLPLYRFFGEKVRDRVPVSYWSRPMEPHETAAEAEVGARAGFTCHKLKARPWNIVETATLMKEAVGADYTVGVDPNQKFRLPHVAARLASELEPLGNIANFENPVLRPRLDWLRLLRDKTHIPIALHCDSAAELLRAVKIEAIDYVNLSGSAQDIRKAAAVAEAADIPCWVQMGGLMLGVRTAYSVHLQATIPNATLPCDELPFVRVADVLDQGLDLSDGHFTVPSGPGLGVTLDMGVVAKYRVG